MTFLEWSREVLPLQARASQLDTQVHAWLSQAVAAVSAIADLPSPAVQMAKHGAELTWSLDGSWLRLLVTSQDLVYAVGSEPSKDAVYSNRTKIGDEVPQELQEFLKRLEVSDGNVL